MTEAPSKKANKISTKVLLQSISLFVVLVIALISIKFTIVEQRAVSKNFPFEIPLFFENNPDILAQLAEKEYQAGNLNSAEEIYLKALSNFSLHPTSLIGLAQVYTNQGKEKQAIEILKALSNLQIEDVKLVWKKAELAQELRQEKILITNLLWLVKHAETDKNKIYKIASLYWDNPLTLLKHFPQKHYQDILQFYIRNNLLEKAQIVWYKIDRLGIQNKATTISFVTFLLENNELELAAAAWRKMFPQNGSLLHNGNFSEPLLNTAFGWQASNSEGVKFMQKEPDEGLTISFDGTQNVQLTLSQIVPLNPGEHIFQGSFETSQLTSKERPYWVVTGYNCDGLSIQDAMLPASEEKTPFAIPFVVPANCKAVKLNLIRNKSNEYNPLIAGNVILQELSINRLSPELEKQKQQLRLTEKPGNKAEALNGDKEGPVASSKNFQAKGLVDNSTRPVKSQGSQETVIQKTNINIKKLEIKP